MRTLKIFTAATAALGLGLSLSAPNALSAGFAAGISSNEKATHASSIQLVGHRYKKYRYKSDRYYDYDRDYVDAPYTSYRRRGRVVVDAPYAFVKRGRHGLRVRAPYVDLFIPGY